MIPHPEHWTNREPSRDIQWNIMNSICLSSGCSSLKKPNSQQSWTRAWKNPDGRPLAGFIFRLELKPSRSFVHLQKRYWWSTVNEISGSLKQENSENCPTRSSKDQVSCMATHTSAGSAYGNLREINPPPTPPLPQKNQVVFWWWFWRDAIITLNKASFSISWGVGYP